VFAKSKPGYKRKQIKSESNEIRDGSTMSKTADKLPQNVRAAAIIYIKGIGMGAADAVPGVSGGTIALIVGIYERLIAAITAFTPARAMTLFQAGLRGETREMRDIVDRLDIFFLVPLGAGILTAVATLTRIVHFGIVRFPSITFGFFFGLIAASAWVLRGDLHLNSPERVVTAVLGFLLAFVTAGQAQTLLGHSLPTTLFAGAIAVSAMVLPGISGSLILILLGQYEYLTGTLSQFIDDLILSLSTSSIGAIGDTAPVVMIFLLGGLCGLLSVSHSIRYALKHYYEATMAFLIALVVGALRAPVARVSAHTSTWTVEIIGLFLSAAISGVFLVLLVEYLSGE
jgi:putative membrane protein